MSVRPIQASDRYERLTAIRRVGYAHGRKSPIWLFRCDCGNEKEAVSANVRSGTTNSCGCIGSAMAVGALYRHKYRSHPLYRTWYCMVARCREPKNSQYKNYGGRGITVCERWMDIRNFCADMGPKPTRAMSIDRIDNNGNYEPGNCRWADTKTQARNTRRNRILTIGAESMCVAAWSDKTGITRTNIYTRLSKGWSHAEAVFGRHNNGEHR